eukprot:TRINITY_DN1353_c0_g3_i1.p2 TRINITY_DN1353_c0_g3~~TRINITY_DN1353_c0_g3_i1.p2  ORF type:complete len:260 (-),score=34.64 TRINITY_DN1353_c0_g3_i1:68-847(-)
MVSISIYHIHTILLLFYSLNFNHVFASDQCTWNGNKQPKLQTGKKIIDITTLTTRDIPTWEGGDSGLGDFMKPIVSIKNGDFCNVNTLELTTHTATHIDAQSHFLDEYREMGIGTESLELNVLIGPTLVVEFPSKTNISSDALELLSIPAGVERVIFKTSNTDRGLMKQRQFVADFIGFEESGAKWMVQKGVKLVGTDYLSVARYDELTSVHVAFLTANMVLVEGLDLAHVDPGMYELICLPLKLAQANGAPARCILKN